jgi:hypothetical protein
MLWLDNDAKTTLIDKINKACAYYLKKYGNAPTLVCANEKTLATAAIVAGVDVRTTKNMPTHYFWVGNLDKPLIPLAYR